MRYLVPATILAALFSFSAYADAEVAKAAPEVQEELCDETTLLLSEAEGDSEEVAQLTAEEEQLLKPKAKAAAEVPQE